MHTLNFLIIPIILVSLFCNRVRLSYLVALLASLTAATFIYAQQNLPDLILTIAIFNLTPLVCLRFNNGFQKQRAYLMEKREKASTSYRQMLKDRAIIKQSNSHLSSSVSHIAELYKVTKDMSAALEFRDVFEILGKKMTELFRFKRCRLILVDEELGPSNIKAVFELKYPRPQASLAENEEIDSQLLKESLNKQKISYLKEISIVQVPLMADNKFLGALTVENLAFDVLDNFSILANQFCLEFRRVRLYQKVQELSITDGLTGLFARRYFLERLKEEIERSVRHNLKLAFLTIDIDHFKRCNDSYGHLTGDAVLKEVARKILDNVREIDLVARLGGEEFAVLLPDTDKAGAGYVAERIRASIDRHSFKAYDQMIKLEVSVGVAAFPEDSTVGRDLIDKSDQALYRAKQEGRNRVCTFKK